MATPALNPVVPQAAPEPTSVFLRACLGLPTERTPIWLMRQAGRYMPEYRALRKSHGMLDLIRTPELAAEVTLQPIEAFGFDAAIIFSDILPPLVGMGLELDFVRGVGPAHRQSHRANPTTSTSSARRPRRRRWRARSRRSASSRASSVREASP